MVASVDPVWLKTVVALRWPVLVAVGLFIVATPRGRSLVESVLSRVSSLSFSGVSVKLTAENATETKTKVETRLQDYSQALDQEFRRSARKHQVRERLEAVVTSQLGDISRAQTQWRATVHIKDVLYDDSLYQLVDYYPSGGGAGRRFSIRFGMLGRVWRLGESRYYYKSIPSDDLVESWGMTREQAESAAVGRQSFMSVILKDAGGSPVGVLYVDGVPECAFGEDNTRLDLLAASPSLPALASSVSDVFQHMTDIGPSVERVDES